MQYLEIDAVKFFACIFIVFLHGIEPGDGMNPTGIIFDRGIWNTFVLACQWMAFGGQRD